MDKLNFPKVLIHVHIETEYLQMHCYILLQKQCVKLKVKELQGGGG